MVKTLRACAVFAAMLVAQAGSASASVIFVETMGGPNTTAPSSNQATLGINNHEAAGRFDNLGLTMSGVGRVNATAASNQPGMSGSANVDLIGSAVQRSFQIAGIDTTSGWGNQHTLTFALRKGTAAASTANLRLDIFDGGSLLFGNVAYSATAAGWQLVTVNFVTALTTDLRISWTNLNGSSTAANNFRIDDVSLSAVPEPSALALTLIGLTSMGVVVRRRR